MENKVKEEFETTQIEYDVKRLGEITDSYAHRCIMCNGLFSSGTKMTKIRIYATVRNTRTMAERSNFKNAYTCLGCATKRSLSFTDAIRLKGLTRYDNSNILEDFENLERLEILKQEVSMLKEQIKLLKADEFVRDSQDVGEEDDIEG